jgi:ABC-2 type transport system ATP-binding protein
VTVLRLDGLHKRYGDVVALAGCSFDVARGELLGFLGPNGAGKTTAMRSVFGLVVPDAGAVSWDGHDIDADARLRFGYMPEQRGLYPKMKIRDQLVYFGRLHGLDADAAGDAADTWLAEFGLSDRSASRLEELSHGNQQRVQLAVAMVHDPELLVLDEPFSGLDPIGVEALAAILQRRADEGTAVVFSSHQLDIVEDLCEQVAVIDEGSIVLAGPVARLRADSPHRYLDVDVADADTGWADSLPNAEIVTRADGRVRLRVDADVDVAGVLEAATAAGPIRHFTFEPPNLSEVFREAVGR